MSGGSFGSLGVVRIGAASGAQPAVVAPAPAAKGAKPEEIYRGWIELTEQRISAEHALAGGYALGASDPPPALTAVVRYFDQLAAFLFQRTTDVGETSNYMAADARRWRELLRAFRKRSAGAKDMPRYHELTRALAAAEFLASEPIADGERDMFAVANVRADLSADACTLALTGELKTRTPATLLAPNIAICLRDANGDVCGEAIIAPPVAEVRGDRADAFAITLAASAEITDVEVSLTRRGVS